MFKISEAAGRLNVETYVIYEKLITHAHALKGHVIKKHGVNYIDDLGIGILESLIFPSVSMPPVEESAKMAIRDSSCDPAIPDGAGDPKAGIGTPEEAHAVASDYLTQEDLEALATEKTNLREAIKSLQKEIEVCNTQLEEIDRALVSCHNQIVKDIGHIRSLEEKASRSHGQEVDSKGNLKSESGLFGFINRV